MKILRTSHGKTMDGSESALRKQVLKHLYETNWTIFNGFFQRMGGLKSIRTERIFPWFQLISPISTTLLATLVTLWFGIQPTQTNCTLSKIQSRPVETTTWCLCVTNPNLRLRYAKRKSNLVVIMEIVLVVNVHVILDFGLPKIAVAKNSVRNYDNFFITRTAFWSNFRGYFEH